MEDDFDIQEARNLLIKKMNDNVLEPVKKLLDTPRGERPMMSVGVRVPMPAENIKIDFVFKYVADMLDPEETEPKLKPISPDRLDDLTVKLSNVLTQNGIDGMQYNEHMNTLRMSLAELLEFMRYDIKKMGHRHTEWWKVDRLSRPGKRKELNSTARILDL